MKRPPILPVYRGYLLKEEDIFRREAIQFIEETTDRLIATPTGRLFIRNIASAFDAYIGKGQFSRAV